MIHSEGLFSERPSIAQLDQSNTLGTMLGISLVHLAHKYHCSIKYEKKVEKEIEKIRDAYMSRISIYFVTNDFEGLFLKKEIKHLS